MATLPTLCEVTYGQQWQGASSVSRLSEPAIETAFRLPSRAGATSSGYGDDTERHTVGCRTPGLPRNMSSTRATTVLDNPGLPVYWNEDLMTEATGFYPMQPIHFALNRRPMQRKNHRAKTAPCLDALEQESTRHWDPTGSRSVQCQHCDADDSQGVEKLRWEPALNAWVEDAQTQQFSYETFVNTVTLNDRAHSHCTDSTERSQLGVIPCPKCLARMGRSDVALATMAKQKMIEDAAEKWRMKVEMMKEKKKREQKTLPPPTPVKPKSSLQKQWFSPRKTFPRQPSPPPPRESPQPKEEEPPQIEAPIIPVSPPPPPRPPPLPPLSPSPPPRDPTPYIPSPSPPPPPPKDPSPVPPPRSPTPAPKTPTPEPSEEPVYEEEEEGEEEDEEEDDEVVIREPTPEVVEEEEEPAIVIEEEEPETFFIKPDSPKLPTPQPIPEPPPEKLKSSSPPPVPTPQPVARSQPNPAPKVDPPKPSKPTTPKPKKSSMKKSNLSMKAPNKIRWRPDTLLSPNKQSAAASAHLPPLPSPLPPPPKSPQLMNPTPRRELPPLRITLEEKKKPIVVEPPPSPSPKKKRKKGKGKKLAQPADDPVITSDRMVENNGKSDRDSPSSEEGESTKRNRWRAQRPLEEEPLEPEPPALPEAPQFGHKSIGDWIYEHADFSTTLPDTPMPSPSPLPSIMSMSPTPLPSLASSPTHFEPMERRNSLKKLPDWAKRRYGVKKKEFDWEDERRREMLAEERKLKAQQMLEKLKGRRLHDGESVEKEEGPSVADYGWLAKYCILKNDQLDLYKHAFEAVDDDRKGRLTCIETMIALRATNTNLSDSEEEFIYRMLDLVGYNITGGSDFKLFAILVALSIRITSLDSWMRSLLRKIDLRQLSHRVFKCKDLWECNVDEDTRTMSIDQLCVELRVGGVSYQHELEVREILGSKLSLDLLDFITYIPLFIMIHQSVVLNPLDDSREK